MHTCIYYAATCACIYKVEPLHNGHFGTRYLVTFAAIYRGYKSFWDQNFCLHNIFSIVSLIRMIHYIVNSYIVVAIISYHDQL